MKRTVVVAVLLAVLVGCGGVEVPAWSEMTTSERSAYCMQLNSKYEAMVARERNSGMGRVMATGLALCAAEGYL
jgi:hypothetical protein